MITLYPASWRFLQVLHPRFSAGVCSAQLFEDLHTVKGVWRRPDERHLWEPRDDGTAGYTFEGTGGEWAPEGPYRLTLEALADDNSVSLTATIENRGDATWERLVGEACLCLRPFLWQDFDGKRILIMTAEGLKSRYDVPTIFSMSAPRYALSAFDGEMSLIPDGIGYLGRANHWARNGLTTTPITEGIIIGHDRGIGYPGDDNFLGFAWDRVAYLWSNTTNCIHCAALFGDVAPGQSVTRRGKIYVAETPENLLEQYHEDFPERGRAE